MKPKLNLTSIARTLIKALLLTFLIFILPGWNSRSSLTAQTDPTKDSLEATASAEPTETALSATDIPEPTTASTPPTPAPPPTKDTGGIGIAAGQWVVLHQQTFDQVSSYVSAEDAFPAPGLAAAGLKQYGEAILLG